MLESTKSKISILKSLFHEKIKQGNISKPIIYVDSDFTENKKVPSKVEGCAFLYFDKEVGNKKEYLKELRQIFGFRKSTGRYMIYYIKKD